MSTRPGRLTLPLILAGAALGGVALLTLLGLRLFVFAPYRVPAGSMLPTLAPGDQFFVNKAAYGLWASERVLPRRGDVIVFRQPTPPYHDYVKRVVAVAGDAIEIRGGQIILNGQAVSRTTAGAQTVWDRDANFEPQAFHAEAFTETLEGQTYTVLRDPSVDADAAAFGPFVVPSDHVFVLGDNRDHAYDSRAWGPVPLGNLVGRLSWVWWRGAP